MCLEEINKRLSIKYKTNLTAITAYKVVKEENEKFYPLYKNKDKPFRIGKNSSVHKAKTYIMCGLEDDVYESGFHSFLSKKDAFFYRSCSDIENRKKERVIEVKIIPKDVICIGKQLSRKTIVSKRIHIKSFNEVEKP